MRHIVLAVAMLLGLTSTAFAQSDPLSELFGSLQSSLQVQTPVLPVTVGGNVYVGRRGARLGGHVSYGRAVDPVVHSLVTQVAIENGINPSLAHTVVRIESGYRCNVPGGGIMQTNARTARSMGVGGSLSNCRNGLTAGMRYLRQAIAMHGYGCAAFSAYQSGIGIHRCSAYGRRVMAMMSGGYVSAPRAYAGRHHVHYAGHHHVRYASYHHHHGRYRYASR